MNCIRCGKTFASHTDGPKLCLDCYMKDINNYQVTNTPSNCDMPLTQDFGKMKVGFAQCVDEEWRRGQMCVLARMIEILLGQQELVQTLILT